MRRLALLLGIVAAGAAPTPATAATLPPVKHVFVVMLENKGFSDTFGPPGMVSAPYLSQTLPSQGALLTRYYGTGHASLDNYIAMISGQPPTPETKADCPDPLTDVPPDTVGPYGLAAGRGCVYPANFLTIADQLANAGLTWKGYMQDIPAPCSLAKDDGAHYARKHNPFVFFHSLRDSGQCQADDVGLDQLPTDLATYDSTPNLVYITPNQCEDAHDACPATFPDPVTQDQQQLSQADAFLRRWVPQILASPAFKQDGLLIVTFDEAIESTACCNEQPGPADPNPGGRFGEPGPGGGNTGAVLLSPFISPHTVGNEYNHYSLLRSVEDLFGLSHLGYAAQDGLQPFGSDVFDRSG